MNRCPQLFRFMASLGLALATWTMLPRAAWADQYEAVLVRAVAAKDRARESGDPASWSETARLFALADSLRPSAETKYELGYAAERLRQDDLAVEYYELSLEQGATGRARDHAQQFVLQNAPKLVHLDLKGQAGTTVSITGLVRGTLPLAHAVVVFAGGVTLDVAMPDGRTRRQVVTGNPGQRLAVDLTEPAPPPQGAVAPRPAPFTPSSAPSAPPPSTPPASDKVREGASLALPITLVVSGSLVAIASGITIATAQARITSARDDLYYACPQRVGDRCPLTDLDKQGQAQQDVNTLATWKPLRTVGYVGLGVGLVTAGVGTVLLATRTRQQRPARGMTADLEVGPAGWSLVARGRF